MSRTNSRSNMRRAEAKIFMAQNEQPNADRITLTRDQGLIATQQNVAASKKTKSHDLSARSNIEAIVPDIVDDILRTVLNDEAFQRKYHCKSLFPIGAGSYGHVFRAVSNATGPVDNPIYNLEYVNYLQSLRNTRSQKKSALLDSYRDSLCLDLVAIKFEVVFPDDMYFNAANKIQLVKEFCVLTELFRNQTASNAMVGFPLPIEFGFLGKQAAAMNLKKVLIFDSYGRPNNYQDVYLGEANILKLQPSDVTCTSYLTMELVGPNLDEWRTFYERRHSESGQMVFSVQTTLKLMDQVLCRLLVMHRKNMVHLDLKPDNLCMGVGKMTNTVYLLDYGLSRICSDDKPSVTMGSRRYMSVGVLNLEPANYMMDIESWFYLLVVLLTDFVPWSDDIIMAELNNFRQNDPELLLEMMKQLKKAFWGDGGAYDKKHIERIIAKAEALHNLDVPDIGTILMSIYLHVARMRKDFYGVSALRMNTDIKNEESDLFKRYHMLRKLLLYPYDCNFSGRGGCFANDKDLITRQEKRRSQHAMLTFVENGRNWCWDWDVWFEDDYLENDDNCSNASQTGCHRLPELSRTESPPRSPSTVSCCESDEKEASPPIIPAWMRHYLARVLGQAATSVDRNNRQQLQPESVLVA